MWTVGIETSSREGSVALLCDDEVAVERSLSREGRRHARTLVHELKEMLKTAGVSPRDCDAVAVSQGPGSFTGLRVGIVCAKTWAFATGCTLVGVDTFLAIAAGSPEGVEDVDVIADAQRGDLYLGEFYRAAGGDWKRPGEIQIVPSDQWINRVLPERVVTGPGLARLAERLRGRVQLVPEPAWSPQAAWVARIGRSRALAGETDDFWAMEPVYLRKSAAEEKAGD